MSSAVASQALFTGLMRDFRDLFNAKVDQVQGEMEAAVASHLNSVRETLDLVRSENSCRESTQNPVFRDMVAGEVNTSMESIERIRGVIDV